MVRFRKVVLIWSRCSALLAAYQLPRENPTEITRNSTIKTKVGLLHNKDIFVSGQSDRIGNLIDEWASHAIPGFMMRSITREWLQGNAAAQCPREGEMCFGKFLAQHTGHLEKHFEKSLNADQLAELNRVIPVNKTGTNHMVYYPAMLKMIADVVGPPLALRMNEYADQYDRGLLAPLPSGHCVVHYRLGDLVEYSSLYGSKRAIIDPWSLADQVASFSPKPVTVEILNGGAFHRDELLNYWYGEAGEEDVNRSMDLLQELRHGIQSKIPHAKVSLSIGGTPDEDWFKLARSPMAVITGGSFAHYAAAAGLTNQVMSPAAKHLMSPQDGQESPREIRPGWTTFTYNIRDW